MKNFKSVFLGIITSCVLTILFLLIFSLVLAKTNFSERYIDSVITIISGVCILISTSIYTRKVNKGGAMIGAIIALMYTVILYILSSSITRDFSLKSGSIWMGAITIVLGTIGGIIGINLKKN